MNDRSDYIDIYVLLNNKSYSSILFCFLLGTTVACIETSYMYVSMFESNYLTGRRQVTGASTEPYLNKVGLGLEIREDIVILKSSSDSVSC